MNRETEVEVEDEQSFLERQLTIIQQQSNVKDPRLSPINLSKGSTPDKRSSLGIPSGLANTTPKKVRETLLLVFKNLFCQKL